MNRTTFATRSQAQRAVFAYIEGFYNPRRRRSRALNCFQQAVFGLCWFQDHRDVPALARDHGLCRATGYRYLDEVIDVLAAQAPELHKAQADGGTHLILDGKVCSTNRLGNKTINLKGKQINAWYSGKARDPGGNVQALSAPGGIPLWVCEVEPGSIHDLTAARQHVLASLYQAASQLGLPTLLEGGYHGAGIGVYTPVKQPTDGQDLDVDTRTDNALLRGLRCLSERGFALLTGCWRALRHITASPPQDR